MIIIYGKKQLPNEIKYNQLTSFSIMNLEQFCKRIKLQLLTKYLLNTCYEILGYLKGCLTMHIYLCLKRILRTIA